MDEWYIGSDLKFLVKMEASGFSMDDDEWEVLVKCGNKVVATFHKSDCIQGGDGEWYVCVPNDVLKNGDIHLVGHAWIPDDDFQSTGVRNEVEKVKVGTIKKV